MIVKLLSQTKQAEQVVAAAIRQCYAAVGAGELKKKIEVATRQRLIRQVVASGHLSTLEHASFTFGIEGISRVTEIQLIRHRLASFSIQSGRYVKRREAKFVIPAKVAANRGILRKYKKILSEVQDLYGEMIDSGIPAEDARYLQPQSLQIKAVVTMNARELLHFFNLRCCRRAQWEIQSLANEMLRLVRKAAPMIFEKAGPTCRTEKICWEGKMSCGLWEKIEGAELRER